MGTLANSEDPDEMPQYAAFHQGLYCLLRQNRSSEKKNLIFVLKLKPANPQYIQHTILTLCNVFLWKIQ